MIDFTKMRRGKRISPCTRIDICKACGKKGELRRPEKGKVFVTHKATADRGLLLVTDHCEYEGI